MALIMQNLYILKWFLYRVNEKLLEDNMKMKEQLGLAYVNNEDEGELF